MAITQLSAFLENAPGTLCDTVAAITDAGVNIRALSVADTKDFGILRMIVSDIEKTKTALADTMVKETPVIAVRMNDTAGALKKILNILKAEGVNIEYVYAFTGSELGDAYVVLRVDETEKAEEILAKNGTPTLSDEDIKQFLNK
ncbi:MAG: ACT domain-containing protein [Clostridiales bacterium]|nr:ACT domain-containing protein [Clostridiales bacterium]